MKIYKALKYSLWLVFSLLYLSGLLEWIFDKWVRVRTEFGANPHPAQHWFLAAHGIFGMIFLVVFGAILSSHVRPRLPFKRRRMSGLPLLVLLSVLCLSVPFLYYVADESLRGKVVFLHTYLGLLVVVFFARHSLKLSK